MPNSISPGIDPKNRISWQIPSPKFAHLSPLANAQWGFSRSTIQRLPSDVFEHVVESGLVGVEEVVGPVLIGIGCTPSDTSGADVLARRRGLTSIQTLPLVMSVFP